MDKAWTSAKHLRTTPHGSSDAPRCGAPASWSGTPSAPSSRVSSSVDTPTLADAARVPLRPRPWRRASWRSTDGGADCEAQGRRLREVEGSVEQSRPTSTSKRGLERSSDVQCRMATSALPTPLPTLAAKDLASTSSPGVVNSGILRGEGNLPREVCVTGTFPDCSEHAVRAVRRRNKSGQIPWSGSQTEQSDEQHPWLR